jgi:predicted dehydrogenase
MIRVAVVGAGAWGANHIRVIQASPRAELAAVVDLDPARASAHGCPACSHWSELHGKADAAIVATPAMTHGEIGCGLLEAGIDVLMEKPFAPDLATAAQLEASAERQGAVLQVGHLERHNPVVTALREAVTIPLFFEIHRLSVFAPRSLDVDVVLDLMIHDLDLVLACTGLMPEEVRAAGVRILSDKVDIAQVRLAFPNGCVANLTASRASTEKVRKMRLFQPGQYISIDYARQDGIAISVGADRQIGFRPLQVAKGEPLALQFDAFLDAVERRRPPVVSAAEATRALQVAFDVLGKIEEHGTLVRRTLADVRSS